ncbi:uncharacterized protein BX664DRAFT_342268 [Halteromyces radiatus]|uniref:uncharacterized protein n=1 Tax=Halteromyces radiatus TaxID=101107 RepID=UPI00221FECAA|nr:uncharacterized protein BX664DRAFT_342268 [Halteromyces radiatus]KAI8080073.1 hypothetical protein BX664DRAFT_342268 [Halteromyces radiatus]
MIRIKQNNEKAIRHVDYRRYIEIMWPVPAYESRLFFFCFCFSFCTTFFFFIVEEQDDDDDNLKENAKNRIHHYSLYFILDPFYIFKLVFLA